MKEQKITGNTLIQMGFPEGEPIGIALEQIESTFGDVPADELKEKLKEVLSHPVAFLKHPEMGEIAKSLLPKEDEILALHEKPMEYKVYGAEGIDPAALEQMEISMRLPVTLAGALMPDAHVGYGLPIGGVLATKNVVIPYAVGVDIGCRMCLSVYDLPVNAITDSKKDLKRILVDNTRFGRESFKPGEQKHHRVLDDPLFDKLDFLKKLQDRARSQIGTSGGGNHFVEFGVVDITEPDNELNLKPGSYFALLSHSGSRGLGANIARHYTQIAMNTTKLPKEARHLAWLDLDTEFGREYWDAMTLAGNYASACHHQIHDRISEALQAKPIARVENHHNFAWKEKDADGNPWIVHRKGATPAGKGELGIIPGSQTAPGYIVRGRGNLTSLQSAAHGAGRAMSRTQAKKTLDPQVVAKALKKAGVELIGSGLDEAPMAYKDIAQVMESQKDLVEILGTFTPKIVRMCGDKRFREVD